MKFRAFLIPDKGEMKVTRTVKTLSESKKLASRAVSEMDADSIEIAFVRMDTKTVVSTRMVNKLKVEVA